MFGFQGAHYQQITCHRKLSLGVNWCYKALRDNEVTKRSVIQKCGLPWILELGSKTERVVEAE
jgi:hypothetical protein